MANLEQTKNIIQANKSFLEDRFHVKEIGLFGSYLRGEQHKESDVDILVDFGKPISMFTFIDLEDYLQEKLGAKVDLVSKNSLKPEIGKYVLNEVLYL